MGDTQDDIYRLEQLLKHKTRQLEEVTSELEAFSHAVSHDLKAPLRAISGYAAILQEEQKEKLGTEGQRMLDIIGNSAAKLTQMINELAGFAVLAKKQAVFGPVNMQQLFEDSVQELLPPEQKERFSISAASLPSCTGDEGLLKEVWVNLVDNAIKCSFSQQHPVIEAGFEEEPGMTIYFVHDKGPGFDATQAQKFFDPFNPNPEKVEGNGTRLAFVKRVIYKHAGSVWAQSIPGEGNTFYFSIPR